MPYAAVSQQEVRSARTVYLLRLNVLAQDAIAYQVFLVRTHSLQLDIGYSRACLYLYPTMNWNNLNRNTGGRRTTSV